MSIYSILIFVILVPPLLLLIWWAVYDGIKRKSFGWMLIVTVSIPLTIWGVSKLVPEENAQEAKPNQVVSNQGKASSPDKSLDTQQEIVENKISTSTSKEIPTGINWEEEAARLRFIAEHEEIKTAWEFREWRSLCEVWAKHEPENPKVWKNIADSWAEQPTTIIMKIVPKFLPPIPGTRKWNDYNAMDAYEKVLRFAPDDQDARQKLKALEDRY